MRSQPQPSRARTSRTLRENIILSFTMLYALLLLLLYLWFYKPAAYLETRKPRPTPPPDHYLTPSSLRATRLLAVIVEPTNRPALVPLMLHFSAVLGPRWGILLYTLESQWAMPASRPFRRAVESGRVEVRFLPDDEEVSTGGVGRFLAGPWLWRQLQATPRVMLFDVESIICSRAGVEVMPENLLGWDFVSAAAVEGVGRAEGCGALSLRNPKLCLEIAEQGGFDASRGESEEEWFVAQAMARGARVADAETAGSFVVEGVYHDRPLGYHQPQRWQADKMREIQEYCPEVKILEGSRAT